MKKYAGVLILAMVIFSSMNFVSAAATITFQEEGIVGVLHSFIEGAYELVKPILTLIIGDTPDTNLFLAKVMLAIVIFAIVWKTLEKVTFFSDTTWVHWLLTIAVSLLSIRWIGNSEIVTAIILPYSALGIAITAGIPFVIWFTLTEFGETHRIWRKISWIFFVVIFVGLWITRYGETTTGGEAIGNFAYIYLVTAGLGLISYFSDPQIQKLRGQMRIEKIQTIHNERSAQALKQLLNDRKKMFDDNPDTYESYYRPTMSPGVSAYRVDQEYIKKLISDLKRGS